MVLYDLTMVYYGILWLYFTCNQKLHPQVYSWNSTTFCMFHENNLTRQNSFVSPTTLKLDKVKILY